VKRRVAILVALILCVSLFLTGGKPKLVSEDAAKEAALAFINQVFDVNETEAVVTYQEQPGATFLNGDYQVTGKEQPVLIYIVSAGKQQDGQYPYVAQVNAETGVAYAAEQSYSFVPKMTADQRVIWDKARGNGDGNSFDYESMDVDCTQFARKWIPEKFELKAGVLGCVDCGGSFDQNGASTTFYVVIRDGTIYHVTVAWPQLTVLEITVLNQTRPVEDMP
jgi:hypothetical protein